MKFRELLSDKKINEEVNGINDYGIGRLVSYSLYMVAQTHLWHLLCPSAQQHVALGEFYDELNTEVDELAERFIAQGGKLESINEPLVAEYNEYEVIKRCEMFREMVTACVTQNPDMMSIVDGVVDLQELIDNKLYKFKLK